MTLNQVVLLFLGSWTETQRCCGSRANSVVARDTVNESGTELVIWEFPKIRGTLFWGPYNKDPTIYRVLHY